MSWLQPLLASVSCSSTPSTNSGTPFLCKRAGRADTPAFIALLQGLPPEEQERVLRDSRLRALVEFSPEVMNHFTLNSRRYRPGQPISDSDRRHATEEHRKLRSAHTRWIADPHESARVLKNLAEFLYVVRSNIAHGEKTPYGPDLDKARRDEEVSSVTVPVLNAIANSLLGRPDRKLLAYGSLRPGQSNATVIEALGGEWSPCRVRGRLSEIDGLVRLRWEPTAGYVDAMMLDSAALADSWQDLDDFEGSRYRRHLVSVRVDDHLCVANCYEAHG